MLRKIGLFCLSLVVLSGCRQIDKLIGAPLKMNNIEAAAQYLDIVCPFNLEGDKLNQVYKEKSKQVDAGDLAEPAFGKYLDSHLLALASSDFRSAQAKTDPRFIWPESVRSLIAEMSAAQMESVSAARQFVKSGGYTAAGKGEGPWPEEAPGKEADQRVADKAIAIRTALRLPARGEACKNGKRSLTPEQIKKLQEG
jgi:hypothetical protein